MIKSLLFSVICFSSLVAMQSKDPISINSTTLSPLQRRIASTEELEHKVESKQVQSEEQCCTVLVRLLSNVPAVILYSPILAADAMLTNTSRKLKSE